MIDRRLRSVARRLWLAARVTTACVLPPAAGANAELRTLPLDPAHAQIGFRAYSFGLIPIDGSFTRFSGTLTIDPDAPQTCHVEVSVDVASLHMPSAAIRDDTLSPNLLDAAAYPTFNYSGSCRADVIEGTLTLHGTTRPLRLLITNSAGGYKAEAAVRRHDYGIVGRSVLAGATVRIRVSTTISR